MKKNLLLSGVLVVLLGITYFAQEKKNEKTFEESLVKDKLFPAPITRLKIAGIDAEKTGKSWMSGEKLLSHNVMNMVEEKIRQLKKVKTVTGNKADFFSSAIAFSVNGDELLVGDLSLDRQGFYLSHNGEMMLVVLEGSAHEITRDENELQPTKYNELRALLSKSPKEFAETQLFRFYPELPLERVTVKATDALPFEIDLKANATTPPPFPGISTHEKLKEKFISLLSQVTLKEEIPYGPFGSKLSELTFMSSGKAVMWELYSRSEKSADAIIVDPVRRRAWHMIGGTLRVFFVQLQDYWDKKIIPPSNFKSFDRESLTFTEGNLRTVVVLVNREPFVFESTGFKVDQEKMLELITYSLNLGPLDQASRVSLLSNSERKQVLSETHLRVEMFGQELLYWVRPEELIIVNLSQGYKAHFPRENLSGGFHFKDVLK